MFLVQFGLFLRGCQYNCHRFYEFTKSSMGFVSKIYVLYFHTIYERMLLSGERAVLSCLLPVIMQSVIQSFGFPYPCEFITQSDLIELRS